MSKRFSPAAPVKFAEHTPLMRQWLGFKEEHPELLLFFRMGDFYELFWEDAERASKLLDLSVAQRGASGGRPLLMAGVPWQSLETHLSRLVRKGIGAAVVDQVGDPALAKGPVERKLTRVVTAGTLMDEGLLEEKRNAPLLAVAPGKESSGLFWASLSAGQARFCEAPNASLEDICAAIEPAEILVAEGEGERVAQMLGAARSVAVSEAPKWHFDAERGAELLRGHFGVGTLDAFGIDGKRLALAAACAGYTRARASLGNSRPNIQELREESAQSSLGMDAATRRALEITQTQRGEGEETLFWALDKCVGGMGSRLLREWLSAPPMDPRESASRHGAVEALMADAGMLADLREALGENADIERAASRAAGGIARPRDFSNIRRALRELPKIVALLAPVAGEARVAQVIGRLSAPEGCEAFLEAAIAEEPSAHARDGGVMRDGWSAELDELRSLGEDVEGALRRFEAREREATGIPTLRVEFNRAHGFQIEISRGQASKAPAHYERKQTLKNAERFVTDELAELERKALGAKEKGLGLEKKLFEKAQLTLQGHAAGLLALSRALAELDALGSFALWASEAGACKPQFTESELCLVELRHPVVEALSSDPFVPNDLALGESGKTLLVTGPNMGGKSTYMRSVAVAAVMARAGSFVAAREARMPAFSQVRARVGSGDDIARGRSTFMVEMAEAAAILRSADAKALCLIDEIGRGTSTYDGMALAWAILRHLHDENRAYTLFSTHYLELTEMAKGLEGARNAHMDAERSAHGIVFLHRLKEGPASRSHGIDVAKLAGIPPQAIGWARATLEAIGAEHGGAWAAKAAEGAGQGAAQAAAPALDPRAAAALAELDSIEPDNMTAKQALDALYALKAARKG